MTNIMGTKMGVSPMALTQSLREAIALSQSRWYEFVEYEKAQMDAKHATVLAECHVQQHQVDAVVDQYLVWKLDQACTVAESRDDDSHCRRHQYPALEQKHQSLLRERGNLEFKLEKVKKDIQSQQEHIAGKWHGNSLRIHSVIESSRSVSNAHLLKALDSSLCTKLELELRKKQQLEQLNRAHHLQCTQEAARQTTLDDLTRGIVYYKTNLGLDFGKAPNENLR
jgi:hypothetical protein